MRQIKVLTPMLFACLAVSVVTAAVATAEKPEYSPAEKNTLASSGEKASLEQKGGIGAITAASSEGSGAFENFKEGKLDELLLGVTGPFAGACTGLDDSVSGSVLAKSSWKIGYLDKAKTKVGVALKLNPEVHFECEQIVTLMTMRGTVICELTPVNVDTIEFLLLCKQEKGVNQFVEILNAGNTAFEKGILESELNGGAFAQSGQSIHVRLKTAKLATIVG